MSRDIHITIIDAGDLASGRGERKVLRVEGRPTDPGEDLTMPPVSDPGEDLTMPPVSDPGEDLTMPPVSDPDRLALAIAKALGGQTGSPFPTILQGTGGQACGCCCKEECEKEGRGSYGDQKGLDYSGFVIVRMMEGLFDKDCKSLQELACKLKLRGLLHALLVSGDDVELGDLDMGTYADCVAHACLDSWRLILSCCGFPLVPGVAPPAGGPVSPPVQECVPCLSGLEALEKQAEASTLFRPLHSLKSYWRVDARLLGDTAADLVARLNALGSVDLAYRELTAADPGEGDSLSSEQGYFDDAPWGIGARCLRDLQPGIAGDGGEVHFVDLEQGWNLEHRDLPWQTYSGDPDSAFGGTNKKTGRHHGTAVLGQLVGKPKDPLSVKGLLPEARLSIASHYFGEEGPPSQPSTNHPLRFTNGHVANAIVATLIGLSDSATDMESLNGVCLLLEVQRGLRPTEVDPADFDAIRLASALGITVIEAGGNGGFDLDAWVGPDGRPSLNRRAGGFRDSGAVIVGAASSELPHERAAFSNYGSRVDCFAWGDSVTSSGYGNLFGEQHPTQEDYYTDTFAGTSAASPIIAGAAGLLQALAIHAQGKALPPARVRRLLSDSKTGTPQGPGVGGFIGVMPDLKAITTEGFCLAPDVYVRKCPCDDGTSPPPQDLTSCPDVLIDDQPLPLTQNATQRFGEGSPWAHATAVGSPGAVDQQKYVYVRMKNRGIGSKEVTMDLYVGRPATLLTADCWHRIEDGPFPPETVPQGDLLSVCGPLDWMPEGAPLYLEKGEHCAFMAVERDGGLSSAPRPLPPDGEFFRLDTLLSFYRRKAVGVRNVHVVPKNWPPARSYAFDVTGTPDRRRTYDFEVFQRLPKGTKAFLNVPSLLAAKLLKSFPSVDPADQSSDPGRIELALPTSSCLSFPSITLRAGACCRAQLRVQGSLDRGHSIALRQLYRGVEIGRITWVSR